MKIDSIEHDRAATNSFNLTTTGCKIAKT